MRKYLFLLTMALCSNILVHADNVVPVKKASEPISVKASAKMMRSMPIMKSSSDLNIFFEDFENWDGGSKWLPEGWKDESKVGHTGDVGWYEQDLTWQVSGKQGAMIPVYSGNACAYIQVSNYYSTTPYEMQDEWLITPAVSVREKDYLYFYLFYSPAYTCYNREENNFTAENTHLEVHVSENGTDWTPIWNVIDEVRKMPEDVLRADLSSDNLSYTPFYIDLKEWSNKTVYFAFRYVGQNGNSMCIDNVAVGLPVPTTYYLAPTSAMYVGLSPEVNNPKTPYMVLPPYANDVWENVSDSYNTIKWTYTDAEGNVQECSDEKLITPAYEPSFVASPKVQAFFNSSASEVYQSDYEMMQIGGSAFGYEDVEGNAYDFYGLANYNCMDPNVEIKYNRTIGFDENSIDKWCGLLGVTPYEFEVRAIANFYAKPASPYVLRNGYLSMLVKKIRPDAVLKMTVRGIDDYGVPAEILAEATCLASEINIPDPEAYTYAFFQFDSPLIVDCPILVEVTGFDTMQDQIYIPALFTNTLNNEAPTYMSLITETGPMYFPLAALQGYSDNSHIAGVAMSIGAEYPWLKAESDNISINAGAEGSSEDIVLSTSSRPEDLIIETDAEWVTATSGEYDNLNRTAHFTLNIAENTDDVDRNATIKISVVGVEKPIVYNIEQTNVTTDISQVDKSETVTVDGEMLIIDSPASRYVSIFGASGVKVGEYDLNNHTVISMTNWDKGVYVLQFSDGKTVKVIR